MVGVTLKLLLSSILVTLHIALRGMLWMLSIFKHKTFVPIVVWYVVGQCSAYSHIGSCYGMDLRLARLVPFGVPWWA